MRRRLFAAWLSLVVVLLAAGLVLADCIQSTLATIDQVIEDVKTQATFEMIQCEANNHNFTLLDPRTLKEIADRYIESADNIDFHDEEFCEQLDEFDKGMKYVIYCHSGKTREMMRGGLGINEWLAAGLPVVGHPSGCRSTFDSQSTVSKQDLPSDVPPGSIWYVRTGEYPATTQVRSRRQWQHQRDTSTATPKISRLCSPECARSRGKPKASSR